MSDIDGGSFFFFLQFFLSFRHAQLGGAIQAARNWARKPGLDATVLGG